MEASGDPIGAAIGWLTSILLGPMATSVGVISVAGLGFAALNGRIVLTEYTRVILGCFVLFGARAIANGMLSFVSFVGPPPAADYATVSTPVPPPASPVIQTYDPYAGASLVNRP